MRRNISFKNRRRIITENIKKIVIDFNKELSEYELDICIVLSVPQLFNLSSSTVSLTTSDVNGCDYMMMGGNKRTDSDVLKITLNFTYTVPKKVLRHF